MACSQTLFNLTSSSLTSLGTERSAIVDVPTPSSIHHLGVQCWEFLPWEVNPRKPLWV